MDGVLSISSAFTFGVSEFLKNWFAKGGLEDGWKGFVGGRYWGLGPIAPFSLVFLGLGDFAVSVRYIV